MSQPRWERWMYRIGDVGAYMAILGSTLLFFFDDRDPLHGAVVWAALAYLRTGHQRTLTLHTKNFFRFKDDADGWWEWHGKPASFPPNSENEPSAPREHP